MSQRKAAGTTTPAASAPTGPPSLGSSTLDVLLGGGLPVGGITEIHGPSSSGKTQLCLTAAARALMAGGPHATGTSVLWLE